MRYKYDKDGHLNVEWRSLKNSINKKTGQSSWINSEEYVDKLVKKYYNDAKTIANTIKTVLLTDADKESYALEALYDAAGTYDPKHRGAKTGRTMTFTSYMMMRIRHVLLREIHLAKMKKRCAMIEVPVDDEPVYESDTTPALELGTDKTKKSIKKYLREIPNSATNDRWDEDSLTVFERYTEPSYEMPFDFSDILAKLQDSRSKLSELQIKILKHLVEDNMSGADIARTLNVTRQAVNLHVQFMKRHIRKVLKKEVPFLKFR